MLIRMVDVHEQSEDKNESELCNIALSDQSTVLIGELNSMHGEAKEKIELLIKTLRERDKLKDHEIKKILFERVNFVSRRTLYNALPQELKREYTKPLPKTINISSEHNVIDVEPNFPNHEEWKEQPEGQKFPEGTMINKGVFDDEDPKDTEIDFLKEKVTELEDALRKTEQFKPASQLQQQEPETNEHYFKWLTDKADGVHSFYYDTYGIELFQNRILSQLKNSGVKVFRRLYFEV